MYFISAGFNILTDFILFGLPLPIFVATSITKKAEVATYPVCWYQTPARLPEFVFRVPTDEVQSD
jgi:hypothetical protein